MNHVLLVAGACVACALAAASAAAEKENWRPVKGAAMKALFSRNEFADGVHFAYQFRADGTFTGTEMSKEVSGAWRVRKDEFCWKWLKPPDPEECYQVQQDGKRVRMIINGSEAWYGTLERLP